MALNARAQALYDVAKGSLPKLLFASDSDVHEMLVGQAKIMGLAWDQIAQWLQDTYLLGCSSAALNQHARDRGTDRQQNESDAQLAQRLRSPTDAITLPAVTDAIDAILSNSGITSSCSVLELRKNRGFIGSGVGAIQCIDPTLIASGETVQLSVSGVVDDYVFDTDGTLTGDVVSLVGATSAEDVATQLAVAINTYSTSSATAAVSDTDATVVLVSPIAAGAAVLLSDTVADGSFTTTSRACGAYCDNGYRMGNDGNVLVVMLPYLTPASVTASVVEAMRLRKAAGIFLIMETRLSP